MLLSYLYRFSWFEIWSCLPKDRLFNERIYFLPFKYILKLIQNKQIVTHSHVRMLWFRMRPSIFIITWVYLFRCWQNITNVLDVFFVRFKEVCTFACLRFIYGKSFTFTLRKPVCLRFFFFFFLFTLRELDLTFVSGEFTNFSKCNFSC